MRVSKKIERAEAAARDHWRKALRHHDLATAYRAYGWWNSSTEQSHAAQYHLAKTNELFALANMLRAEQNLAREYGVSR